MNENNVIEKYIENYKSAYEKKILIIMVGVPGSGKTTVSKILEKDGIAKISTDDLKSFYKNEKYKISDLFKIQYKIIERLMKLNKSIVADSNSDKEIYRNSLSDLAYKYGYKIIIIYCYADKKIIYKRMDERKKTGKFYVPPNKIDEFINELEVPQDSININSNLDIKETEKSIQELLKKIKYEREEE